MAGSNRFLSLLYRKLSSLRTSVYVLGVLCIFYVIGTIFPQGGDINEYEKAGGRFLEAVRLFNLLDVFNTPWFLVPAFVLFLNVSVCTYDRFLRIRARRGAAPAAYSPDCTVHLALTRAEAEEEVSRILTRKMRFKVLRTGTDWTVMEKGLSYRWLTWLYHAGIAISFVGFFISGLFVREGIITLRPGEEVEIVSTMPENRGWLVPSDHSPPGFKLVLDEFITEYTESPRLDYPKDKRSRVAIALGWKDLSYRLDEDSFFPKDWFSRLRVVRDGSTLYEKKIEVNDPLRFEGYTFYQLAYEQRLKLRVGERLVEAEAGKKVDIPSIGTLRFGPLRTGTLFRLDGTTDKITPFVTVKRLSGGKTEELGRLVLNGHIRVGKSKLSLVDFEESSVLSYRYDPGVPILWVAGSIVFAVMTLRCFGRWYELAYRVEERDGTTSLLISIRSKGLGADPARVIRRLSHHLPGVRS